MPRKLHKKVKTGCLECRKRRVKCTEEKPKCRACVRRGVICDYPPPAHDEVTLSPAPSASSTNHDVASTSSLQLPEPQHHGSPIFSTSPSATITVPLTNTPGLLFDVHEMALLHHWTLSTSQVISKGTRICTFWQKTATELALQHPYVLQQIISLASLHLAHTNPSDKSQHMAVAARNCNKSLQGFHAAVARSSDDVGEGCAVFLWSMLNILYVFSTVRLSRDINHGTDDPRDRVLGSTWIPLTRGIGAVVQDFRPAVESETFSVIMNLGNWHTLDLDDIMGEQDEHFCRLQEVWQNNNDKKIYDEALRVLRRCRAFIAQFEMIDNEIMSESTSHSKATGPLMFIFIAPEAYFTLLQQRQPAALMLFAFFGALLYSVDDCWAMEGWGKDIVAVVEDLLGSYWKPWIAWPMRVVGLT